MSNIIDDWLSKKPDEFAYSDDEWRAIAAEMRLEEHDDSICRRVIESIARGYVGRNLQLEHVISKDKKQVERVENLCRDLMEELTSQSSAMVRVAMQLPGGLLPQLCGISSIMVASGKVVDAAGTAPKFSPATKPARNSFWLMLVACWVGPLGRNLARSYSSNPDRGGNLHGGPLVRFIAAASRPVMEEQDASPAKISHWIKELQKRNLSADDMIREAEHLGLQIGDGFKAAWGFGNQS